MSDSPSSVLAIVTASGFTPCPDVLVQLYGAHAALTWGKVWRYSQMDDGVCRASILRIAKELNLSANTVTKYFGMLEKDGYIKDSTPDVRNKPHIYEDTGKLCIKINLDMAESGTQNLRSRYSKFAHEESTTKGVRGKTKIFSAYKQNIGELNPLMKTILVKAMQEYSAAWVFEAICLAVENNKLNWRYCETILKRWKKEGKDEGKGKPKETLEDALRKAGYDQ